MSEVTLPRRHSESPPPKGTIGFGKANDGKLVTFPATRPVLHDRAPDPENGRFGKHLFAVPDPRRAGSYIEFVADGSDADGYAARAVEHSIFAEAEGWPELCMAAVDAVRCHFGDPDTIPSDSIEPGWGNGVIDSFRSKLPTPPDRTSDAITASLLLIKIEQQLREIATAVGELADTLRDPNEAA